MPLKPLLAVALLLPLNGIAGDVSIQLDHGEFHVTGVSNLTPPAEGWASIFSVSTAGEGAAEGAQAGSPAMLGSYAIENGVLVFHPRFPLAQGIRYRAVYRAPGAAAFERLFDGPAAASRPATRVTRVYPSGDLLPANQLKLYLYFSAPMQRGGVWSHIHLLDESGQPVNLAFLEIDQELWDAGNQRLTVLFDPGRIKRGVAPEREIGPPIVPGKLYTLRIDRDLLDAGGQPLAETFNKQFRGTPAVRSGIDLKDWRISAPSAGSTSPLVIDFPRPLDYALLEHAMSIHALGAMIQGQIAIEKHEQQLRFTPAQPWPTGDFELIVDTALEDLAGNRIGRAFDVDLGEPSPRIAARSVTLRFHIGTR